MVELIQNNLLVSVVVIYLLIISLVSIIVCIYDKKISKKNRVELRISEAKLMLLSAIGGGLAMFLCMLAIRHKTKHFKFMVGIPFIMLLQGAAVYLLFHFGIL